ncbi:MAG: hypothetical protein ACJ72Z_10675 [Pyrinomonadaceae bacterium]
MQDETRPMFKTYNTITRDFYGQGSLPLKAGKVLMSATPGERTDLSLHQ